MLTSRRFETLDKSPYVPPFGYSKYMELRSKLDWTRAQTERVLKKKEEELKNLLGRFTLLSDQHALLDDLKDDTVVARKQTSATKKTKPPMEGRRSVIELKKTLKLLKK